MQIEISISGPAGSGKSFIGATIVQALRNQGLTVTWVHDDAMYKHPPIPRAVVDRITRVMVGETQT